MKIIQIPGLTLENSKDFFNILKISRTDVATFFAWQELQTPVEDLSDLISDNLSTSQTVDLFAKSYGSYIAIRAIEHARVENPYLDFNLLRLNIFGLPYRLGYPPDPGVLNNLEVEFNDPPLAFAYLQALESLKVSITIYQGDKDDLGPIDCLEEQVKEFNNIKLNRLLDQSHNIDPTIIKFDRYE